MKVTGFIGGAYTSRARIIDCQECVNLYPEIESPTSKNVIALIGTPGLELFTTLPTNSGNRGLYTTSTNRMFTVIYNTVYEILANAGYATIGTIGTTRGACIFADNGLQLMITDGLYGYIVNLQTNVLSKITDTDYPENTSHVAFINGVFVVNNKEAQQLNLQWSDDYDGTSWDGANITSAEGSPDKLIAIQKINNELVLFGNKSIEVFYDGGADGFMRIAGAYQDIGTVAPYSTATNGNSVFFLGSTKEGHGVVWNMTNYMPQRVSTHAIEYLISQMPNITNAIGFCYQQEGHAFYVLSFPSGNKCFVYDLTTGLWHERNSYDNDSGTFGIYRALHCASFNGKTYVGDYDNSNIYELNLDHYYDNGNLIQRVRTTPHIHQDRKRLFFDTFEVDMERGVGLSNGVEHPEAMLQWSDDGGNTWSNVYHRRMGAKGDYSMRVIWRRLGSSRDRIFRFIISDPVKVVLVDANMEVLSEQ